MKTIHSTNQTFQYLFSVVTDAKIETIEKLRTAKAILSKAFPVVNAYEKAKSEPVSRVKAIDSQIQMIHQANKAEVQKDKLAEHHEARNKIINEEIQPLSMTEVDLQLEDTEINFIKTEMESFLAEMKKMNTMEEMEMFDILYTALESAQ